MRWRSKCCSMTFTEGWPGSWDAAQRQWQESQQQANTTEKVCTSGGQECLWSWGRSNRERRLSCQKSLQCDLERREWDTEFCREMPEEFKFVNWVVTLWEIWTSSTWIGFAKFGKYFPRETVSCWFPAALAPLYIRSRAPWRRSAEDLYSCRE